ncbi:hypothetical protein Pst134EB_008700 [Puccinia striiformis f. sp. tritici]|nr:hypothetical protein Pst134EB_008700 [Puccinia striiformis f. sp. tritici]
MDPIHTPPTRLNTPGAADIIIGYPAPPEYQTTATNYKPLPRTMATSDDPLKKKRLPAKPLKRHELFGVSQSLTAISFFGPPDSQRERACLIQQCGDTLVENKSTKTNFVNHIARKHPGEWKLALEASKNSEECVETLQSSGTPATSQSHLTPMHKIKGPLQQIMLKTRQSNFDTNLINWIIEDQLSYAKVKCPQFFNMIQGLDSGIM